MILILLNGLRKYLNDEGEKELKRWNIKWRSRVVFGLSVQRAVSKRDGITVPTEFAIAGHANVRL